MRKETYQNTWNVVPGTLSSSEMKYSAIIYNKMVGKVTAVEILWKPLLS
jgi:hypothetical protein